MCPVTQRDNMVHIKHYQVSDPKPELNFVSTAITWLTEVACGELCKNADVDYNNPG
jgi:hypothetical protein